MRLPGAPSGGKLRSDRGQQLPPSRHRSPPWPRGRPSPRTSCSTRTRCTGRRAGSPLRAGHRPQGAAARASREIEQFHWQSSSRSSGLTRSPGPTTRSRGRLLHDARTFFLCAIFSFLMRCTGPPTPPRLKRIFRPLRPLVLPLTKTLASSFGSTSFRIDRATPTCPTWAAAALVPAIGSERTPGVPGVEAWTPRMPARNADEVCPGRWSAVPAPARDGSYPDGLSGRGGGHAREGAPLKAEQAKGNGPSRTGCGVGAEEFPLMIVLSIIYPCNFGCPNCPYTDGNSRSGASTTSAGGPVPRPAVAEDRRRVRGVRRLDALHGRG